MDAIVAGTRNDLGSGSQVDLCVLCPDGTSECLRDALQLKKSCRNVSRNKKSNAKIATMLGPTTWESVGLETCCLPSSPNERRGSVKPKQNNSITKNGTSCCHSRSGVE